MGQLYIGRSTYQKAQLDLLSTVRGGVCRPAGGPLSTPQGKDAPPPGPAHSKATGAQSAGRLWFSCGADPSRSAAPDGRSARGRQQQFPPQPSPFQPSCLETQTTASANKMTSTTMVTKPRTVSIKPKPRF